VVKERKIRGRFDAGVAELALNQKGVPMWYAVQVLTGEEELVRQLCEMQISEEILEKCFIPYYERPKRFHGQWHTLRQVLFPGYVFLITSDVYALYEALKQIQHFTKILGNENCLLPLHEGEVAFLERLGGEKHVTALSIGIIEQDQVRITAGPLMGLEGCIKKIDRHKRTARIRVEMFGRTIDASVGLEIVEKL
jgi:transcriptional antiterminator NusG